MATVWQWQGDATDGAGYIRILSGSSSVPITGTVTLASGSATIGVVSGTVTLASGSATIGVISGSVTLSGSSLKWTPLSLISTVAGTEKVITIPAGKEYWVRHIQIEITTTATVGNRIISLNFDTGATANAISNSPNFLPTIAASLSRYAAFNQAYSTEAAFAANSGGLNIIRHALPDLVLSAGDRIQFTEAAAIDRVNDTIKYYVRVLERSV